MYKGAPCLNCDKRHLACHDKCKGYKEFKERHELAKERRKEYRYLCYEIERQNHQDEYWQVRYGK